MNTYNQWRETTGRFSSIFTRASEIETPGYVRGTHIRLRSHDGGALGWTQLFLDAFRARAYPIAQPGRRSPAKSGMDDRFAGRVARREMQLQGKQGQHVFRR